MTYSAVDRDNGGAAINRIFDILREAPTSSSSALPTSTFYGKCSESSDFQVFKKDLEFLSQARVLKSREERRGTKMIKYWWLAASIDQSLKMLFEYISRYMLRSRDIVA